MRYLLLSSFCVLLFVGCSSTYKDLQKVQSGNLSCIHKFVPVFHADWYNASVDVIGKHLSGLLLFKTMADSSVRIVFTNEVGVTFFNFELAKRGDFKVHQVISQLDRKPVITLLRKDFELILMRGTSKKLQIFTRNGEIFYAQPGKKETDYFITDKDCASLLRIEKASKRKKKAEVLLIGDRQKAPDSVYLKHFTFDMQIALKKIQR